MAAVRKRLRSFGITPNDRLFKLAWDWAYYVGNSYALFRWPSESEIAAQYMVLLLAEMQKSYCLKLPFRAFKMPDRVAEVLPKSVPDILRLTEERELAALDDEPITIDVKPLPFLERTEP